jgi:drug/metabolite transporter (DMT)-like permease
VNRTIFGILDATDAGHGSVLAGIAWMLLASLGFAGVYGIVRHLSTDLHPFVIVFFRSLFGLAVMVPWILSTRLDGLRTRRVGLHLVRAVLSITVTFSLFWGFSHMPMAQAMALNFTAPLFTTVFAVIILGEVAHLRRWSATIIGLLGTIVILRPGMEAVSAPALVVLFGSLVMAGSVIVIKILSRTESVNAIVTYMVIFITPLSLVPALFVWTTPDWRELAWLFALGVAATFAHQCVTRALRAADASVVMPFEYTQLPFVAAIGYLAFGQGVDAWTWSGAAIIAAAGIYIAHREAVIGRTRTATLAAIEPDA